MKKRPLFSIITAIILAVVMFGVSACQKEGSTVVPVTSVEITQSTASLKVGETVTLTAEVSPSDATNKSVSWSSDATSVATVDSFGTVSGVSAGTANITAKAGGVTSAACVVTVTQKTDEGGTTVAVTSVTITPASASVEEGETVVLSATVLPTDATDQTVTWKSSDDSIATVNSQGVVTGVSSGVANITAKAGGVTSTACVVTVTKGSTGNTPVAVTSVTLSQYTASVNKGATVTLTATVNPNGATYQSIEWESSDNSIATVAGGVVTGVAVGTAYIRAKAGGKTSDPCAVSVTDNTTPGGTTVPVTSVTITPSSVSLKTGETTTLSATVLPADATDQAVEWKSDNESVATVSTGLVTAGAAGIAHITAKAGGKTSEACTVTVTQDTAGGGDTTTSNIPYEYYGNEAAAFEWTDSNPASAKVEYKLHSETTYTRVDSQLVRAKTATLARADIVGLKGGEYYDFKITPSSGSVLTATNKKIAAHDRSGYAFHTKSGGQTDVGAYNADGTLKANAKVIYLTETNKNNVDGNNTSIAKYLGSFKNSKNTTPIVIRVIGTVGSATWTSKTYPGYSKSNPLSAYDFVNLTPGNNNSKLAVQDGKEYTQTELINGGYNTLNNYPAKYNGAKCDPINGLNSKIKCSTDDKLGFVYDSCWNDCSVYNMENVTIEGIGEDAEIFQWGFTFKQCSSIEVRNLHFDDYTEDGCSFEGDTNSSKASTLSDFPYKNIWLHHNTFDEGMNYWDVCDEQDKNDGDGSTDFKGVKNITIAYNTYIETHKTNLIGGGDSHTTANVTFHHNYYKGCNQRMPLGRQANMHMYNNYYDSSTLYSISLRAGAYAFIENCVFTEDASNHHPLELVKGKNKDGDTLKASAKIINCTIDKSKIKNDSESKYLYTGEDNNDKYYAGGDRSYIMTGCDNTFAKNFDTNANLFYYKDGKSDVKIMHALSEITDAIPKVAGVQKHEGVVLDPDTFTPGGSTDVPTNPPATGGQTVTVIDDFTQLNGKETHNITLSGGAAGYLVNNKIVAEKPGNTMSLSGTGLKLQAATKLKFRTAALSKTVKLIINFTDEKYRGLSLITGNGTAQNLAADSSGNVTITLQANTEYIIGRAEGVEGVSNPEAIIAAIKLIIG